MSKAFAAIGKIAGAVSSIAAVIPGGQVVAGIAAMVATVANIGAALLYKPPPARGSVTQVVIAPDAPIPYAMGEGLIGGVVRHDVAYGATLKKVPNPYRFMPMVCSLGPVQSISPRVDQAAVSSYYTGFLYTTTQLGACPEAAALVPQWAGAPGWTTASKLSGKAAIGWSLLFDRDGKRFAGGVPPLAAYGQWVKVYDPRLDSTFPGGSGACRLGNESTYVWSENPALHAGTYAYGRYQNGKRVFGMGLPAEGINWADVAAWANVCAANGWTIFGRVFEPGDRWANLTDICLAGGAQPLFSGAVLGFHYSAPRVALDTATDADLAEADARVTAQASWRERVNGLIPKCVSPAHSWEMIDLPEVSVASYVTEDGEAKTEVMPFNLVKVPNQAAQLAAYRLVDGRELQPIEITYGPRLFGYRPGDCLELNHPELGLDTLAVILRRRFDPQAMTVTFTMIGESPAKHDFALGRTTTPPPTPALGMTGADRDAVVAGAITPLRGAVRIISQDDPFPLTSDDDQIDIAAFAAVLDTGESLNLPAGSVTGLSNGTQYGVFYALAGGTYSAAASPADTAMADPGKVFLGWQSTSTAGTFPTPSAPPGGFGGMGSEWNQYA